MTHSDDRPATDADGTPLGRVPLPLVSVVVVNYNYARFLPETIASVFAQTWPRLECIVVDNASNDGSVAIVEAMQRRHPTLRLLRREANDGQTAAAFDGVAVAKGAYVILLDGDDLLLPDGAATHMRVHLSTRVHVGFTCGDMLQMVDDQVVLSTGEAMAAFVRANPATHGLLRPGEPALGGASLGRLWNEDDRGYESRVHLVPRRQKKWVWSPTSGLCFRRDALELVCDTQDGAALRARTDLYLALGINAICGSILIDEPVFVYRLHGSNVFTARAQMAGVLAFDPKHTSDNPAIARRLLIDQFVSHIERFIQDPWQALGLIVVLRRLAPSRAYLGQAIAPYARSCIEAIGTPGGVLFLLLAGAPWSTIWRAARP